MCTVSFVPLARQVIITSSRDMQTGRRPATPPAVHLVNGSKILFPRDMQAGGTWFAIHEQGRVAVLLNGAWSNHIPQSTYRKSRGLLLLDLISENQVSLAFRETDMRSIEPFTILVWEDEQLFEGRWDGMKKYDQYLDARSPHIWSSVTLYDGAAAAQRMQWFDEWLTRHSHPTIEDALDFHLHSGDGDPGNDLLMDRNGIVSTVSITAASISPESAALRHVDVQKNSTSSLEFAFSKTIEVKS